MGILTKAKKIIQPRFNYTKLAVDKRHPLREGLRFHLPMGELGGVICHDTTNVRNGTFGGNPTWATRAGGASVNLDASGEDIEIMDPFNATTYSMIVWAEFVDVTSVNIMTRTDSSGPVTSWSHQLRLTAASKAEAYHFGGPLITGSTTIVAGQMYQIGTKGTNTVASGHSLYVNGKQDATPAGTITAWTGGDRFNIGAASGDAMGQLLGYVHQVRYYQRELSDAEFLELYEDPWADMRRRPIFQGATFFVDVTMTPGALSATFVQPSVLLQPGSFAASLPLMTLSAESYAVYTAEPTLLMMTLEATCISGTVSNFSGTLPMLTLEATVGIKVNASLPVMTLSATASGTNNGSVEKPLPLMTLEATCINEGLGTFIGTLPMFELEIDLRIGVNGDFAATLPMLTLEGYGTDGAAAGAFASTLPIMTLDATGYDDINGDFAQSLPMMTLDAFADSYQNRII